MFITEHLEGRIRYETDKVVCIDVYVNPSYSQERLFLSQVLFSLVNNRAHFLDLNFSLQDGKCTFSMKGADYEKEIKEGIEQYLQIRKDLEID